MKFSKAKTCYGKIGCYFNFASNNVHLNRDDPYYNRIGLIKLICISAKYITVLVWFYSESSAIFVGLSQKICVSLYIYIYIYTYIYTVFPQLRAPDTFFKIDLEEMVLI